ncbi:MAG: RtcB family protein [Akkermansia sp.]|nr:RtcB family protein [Akkermansia sp.]
MITIQGQYATARVMIDEIDADTRRQIYHILAAPVSEGSTIAIMPDTHAGNNCVVGFTQQLNSAGAVSPNMLGVDIGCTVSLFPLGAPGEIDFAALDAYIRSNVAVGVGEYRATLPLRSIRNRFKDTVQLIEDAERLLAEDGEKGRGISPLTQLGSLGGGNHFISLNQSRNSGVVYLGVHCGSRNFGLRVNKLYQHLAVEYRAQQGYGGTPEMAYLDRACGAHYEHYLTCVHACQQFARLNHLIIREAVARYFAEVHKLPVLKDTEGPAMVSMHNYLDLEGMVLRKGAIRAAAGEPVVIPFNMRDGIGIGTGLGNAEWNNSAPHGAGRILTRSEARACIDPAAAAADMAAHGVFTTSLDYAIDEAPDAYKPMELIRSAIAPAVDMHEVLPEIYNLKGR